MKSNQLLKSEIRQTIRQQRNDLSSSQIQSAEQGLVAQLLKHCILNEQRRIASFLSFDGEISTRLLNEKLLELNTSYFLPKLRPYKPNRLWFMPYSKTSPMTPNRYGIPEVDLSVDNALAVSSLDIVLLPLVAFDKTGNRLGMGGGFYDATFAHLLNREKRPRFIGLAYEMQMVDALPSDPWDLPLDGVCTELNFYSFTD